MSDYLNSAHQIQVWTLQVGCFLKVLLKAVVYGQKIESFQFVRKMTLRK